MSEPLTSRPDALVLGGGGTLGEAWMRGLLAGAEATRPGLDFRACEYFVGTSAGSIVAATLAAGRRPEAGRRAEAAYAGAEDGGPEEERSGVLLRLGAAAATPFAPLALSATAPAGALLRAAALRAAPRGRRRLDRLAGPIDALGATWDGRLRIAAVDLRTGRRVLFGAPGAPRATVTEAVLASCSIPGYFAPVEIGGREYVDGGVWSPTNLDAIPGRRGSEVLCLNPTASIRPVRAVSAAAAGREALVLRGRGATVRIVAPDVATTEAIGPSLMDGGRSREVLAAAYAQGRRLAGG
jgi:NTE family protein